MAIKYFAYGSNLDLPQMKRRCPSSKLISKGSLSGYRLTFNRFSSGWGGGVADVIQEQGSEVWGLVFEISDSDLERLDRYEGYNKDRNKALRGYKDRPKTDLYERWKAAIDTPNGQVCDVWVYTVVEKQKFVPPTSEYLQIIKDAAVKWNFPKSYQDDWYLIPCTTDFPSTFKEQAKMALEMREQGIKDGTRTEGCPVWDELSKNLWVGILNGELDEMEADKESQRVMSHCETCRHPMCVKALFGDVEPKVVGEENR